MFFLQRQTPRLCRPRLPCRDSPEADNVIITIESHRALVDPVDDSIAIVVCFQTPLWPGDALVAAYKRRRRHGTRLCPSTNFGQRVVKSCPNII
jgi:hypothetical protein